MLADKAFAVIDPRPAPTDPPNVVLPMPGIQSSLLSVLPELVASRGLDPAPLWQRMGLGQMASAPPSSQPVSTADWAATLDLASELTADPAIGVWAALAVRPRHLGALGYALMSSGQGADGLAVFDRFQRQLCDTLSVRLAIEPGQVALHHEASGEALPRHAGFWCFLFAARLSFARWVSGRELVQSTVAVPAPRPDAALATAFERVVACPVQWQATEAVERFPQAWLQWLNPHADASLHALMHQKLVDVAPSRSGDGGLIADVAQSIRAVMQQGEALELSTVWSHWLRHGGRELPLSPRQWQDRLAELGRPFKALVTDVRRGEALRLLRDSPMPLHEVARACGYAEASPFHRAVRRWTGQTPAQVRLSGAPLARP